MPGTFDGINMASSALAAFQRSLSVTGDNIANVNTPGYSRQTVVLGESTPTTFYAGGRAQQLGTGVTIESVSAVRDTFLQAQMNTAQSGLGKNSTLASSLSQIESVVNDTTGDGIGAAIDQLYNSFSALAAKPNDASARLQVQTAGSNLTGKIQGAYNQLDTIGKQFDASISSTITNVNGYAKQISDLNAQIRTQQASGEQANSLIDQRTQAIQNLSGLVDVQTYNNADGTVTVNSNQFQLVNAQKANTYPSNYNATTGTVSDSQGTYSVRSGKLAGLFQSITTVKGYESNLDTLAKGIKDQVNALHSTGTTGNGATGVDFFGGTGAHDFSLSTAVASDPANIAAGTTGSAGDGSLALKISQQRDVKQGPLGNQTVSTYYTNFLGAVGIASQGFQNAASTQQAVVGQVSQQIQSVSGVSLDEEMTHMLQYQRSYQAAAQVLNVFNETLTDVINLIK